jgi:GxxExxY protein
MDADRTLLMESALTEKVIGAFYDVYNELGGGLVEAVYENALAICLRERGLEVMQQSPLKVWFRGQIVGEFRIDLIVGRNLVIEVKAVSQLIPAHEVQLVNHLKATRMQAGLLLNLGVRPQSKRRVPGYGEPDPRPSASIRVSP